MLFSLDAAYELLGVLSAAIEKENVADVKGEIKFAQVMTAIMWCTRQVVYPFSILDINAANFVVSIQIGYCVSDNNSLDLFTQINYAKSQADGRDVFLEA